MRYNLFLILILFTLTSCSKFRIISRGPAGTSAEVSVLGDLEGNIDRFNDFIQKSDALFLNSSGELDLVAGKRFVFLGDVMDRGPGSLRIMNDLVNLKEKYPENVTLILGNRDINKLRIMSLMDSSLTRPVPEIVIPWHKKTIEESFNIKIPDNLSAKEFQEFVKEYDNPLLRFKSFLAGMNAPLAFEFRREELEILYPEKIIDDHFVFTSFLQDYDESGILRRYLKNGELGKIIDGNIFVHGAVTNENFGFIPGRATRETDPEKWIDGLNDFARDEIDDWFSDSRKGQSLIDYHAPRPGSIKNLNSVVYARFSDDAGNPIAPGRKLIQKLRRYGIYRVIVGHTPTGDYPIIVRKPNFEVLLTDSSFSSVNKASKITIKGKDVLVETEISKSRDLIIKSNIEEVMNPLGMKTSDGYRVIGKFSDSDNVMILKVEGKGRRFSTKYVEESALNIANKGLVEVFEQRVNSSCRQIMQGFLGRKI